MKRTLLASVALVLISPAVAAEPLRIDASRPLREGCLAWSDRARVALCVTGEGSVQGGSKWTITFVGPGEKSFQPIPIMERVHDFFADHPLLITLRDAARLRALIREWHFEALPEPRAFLKSGDQVSWGSPAITLRWQPRITAKGRYDDEGGGSWKKSEDTISLRCKKGPPIEIERWESNDDQSGSELRAYLITLRNRSGIYQKSYVLFDRKRSWAVEGDSGHEVTGSFLELPKGCEWLGF